jgi:hypothetical protein
LRISKAEGVRLAYTGLAAVGGSVDSLSKRGKAKSQENAKIRRRIPTVNCTPRSVPEGVLPEWGCAGQHAFRYFLCFEYILNLHMLVDEWNQELHFAPIIGILLSEFNN